MAQNNRVVYSCITGGYDNIAQHGYVADGWDYILFTDNEEAIAQGRVGHWQVLPLTMRELDNTRNARYHKINPHIILSQYRYSLYIDGTIVINGGGILSKIEGWITSGELIAIPPHPQRTCIYDEADMVRLFRLDSDELIDSTLAVLRMDGYPPKNGLFETNVVFREHNAPKVVSTMERWWEMVRDYSRRDQLSFGYAAWLNDLTVKSIYDKGDGIRVDPEIDYVKSDTHKNALATAGVKTRKYPKLLVNIIAAFIRDSHKRRLFRVKYKG